MSHQTNPAKNKEDNIESYASSISDMELVKRLGGGTFGNVYECKTSSGRMACKFMMNEDHGEVINTISNEFLREASIYSYIGNKVPGLCTVREIGPAYMGMCLEKGDLGDVVDLATNTIYHYENITGGNSLNLEEIVGKIPLMDGEDIMESMASFLTSLEILHSLDIAHLDIKPANILVGKDGTWKLCDLGISRKIREEDIAKFEEMRRLYRFNRRKADDGIPLIHHLFLTDGDSTLDYAAPETMAKNENRLRPVFTVADIWSTGVLFYQLLTGFYFLRTIAHYDAAGNIITYDIAKSFSNMFNANKDIYYVLNMLRFLTSDMKRSGMDFYHSGWKGYIADLENAARSKLVALNTVSPMEIIKCMRPELSSQHADIWELLVNMLDPNPLTRYTASDCLDSSLLRPYRHIRDSMWNEYIVRRRGTARNISVSTTRTLLVRFVLNAMGEDNDHALGWVKDMLISFPGMRNRMYRILTIVNSNFGENKLEIEDVRIVFFCIYYLSFIAEYGIYTYEIFHYYPGNIINTHISPPVETVTTKYTREETFDRINYTLYYIVVNILKFNLWL